ncbi:MAG: alpha/beta fold hydrolase [Desulfobulbaceae bacterium]|nr:MAG: alpha/beta fold hydrolase [Desulfobulbaceae bacterium]
MYPDYPFTSRFVSLSGHRLHYIDEGRGPVVVLVHGNPTWSYYFRKVISLLMATHRVIAVDHIGCGLSDKPQNYPYTLGQHMDNLQGLLDHLRVDRYSLIGHDWGGAIGMGCAGRQPQRIDRMVMMNTAAFRSTRIPLRIRVCRWPIVGPLIVRGLNGFARAALFMAAEKRLPRDVARAYLAPYDSWRNRVAVYQFVRDIPLQPGDRSYQTLVEVERGLDALRDRQVPLMLAWGGKDFCFDEVFFREWCQRFPRAERHFFADGGHYILEDKFNEIAPLLARFFSEGATSGSTVG